MSYGDCYDIISILPPEVIKHILGFLSYPNLQSLRPTCKVFNAAAVDLLGERLHRLRLRVDKAVVQFLRAPWLRTDHTGIAAVLTYAKRLMKGSGSLVMLAGMVRAADVCSRQLVQVGALPPLPGSVFDQLLTSVNMATWKNPLVGVNRLQYLYRNLLDYFTHNRVLNAESLPPAVMFQTVLEVLLNMPRLTTSGHLELIHQGIRLSCTLPGIRIKLQTPGHMARSETDDLLLKLVQLSMHVVERYILTSQAQNVIGDDEVSESEWFITDIQLTVPCMDVQNVTLQILRRLEPKAFFVILSGFRITSPLDLDDVEEKEQIYLRYNYCESVWSG